MTPRGGLWHRRRAMGGLLPDLHLPPPGEARPRRSRRQTQASPVSAQSSPLRFRAGASQPSLRLAQDANLGWGGRDGSGEGSRAKPRSSSPCFSRRAFPPEVTEGSGHGKRQAESRMPAPPRLPTALPESKAPLPLKSAGTYFGRDERRIAPSAGRQAGERIARCG